MLASLKVLSRRIKQSGSEVHSGILSHLSRSIMSVIGEFCLVLDRGTIQTLVLHHIYVFLTIIYSAENEPMQ